MSSQNTPLHPLLRVFSAGVIVVLLVGAGLFLTPELVKPRWPWAVTPFNSRFLGGFYIAEIAGMASLLYWNRWSPARMILVMALVFTLVATVASLLNLDTFNFQRKSSWVWFIVYVVSAAVAAAALLTTRNMPPARAVSLPAGMRSWLRIEWVLLALYGVGLIVLPAIVGGTWPWPIDRFHAQAYSAVFLSGAVGVYLLATSPKREEMRVLGLAQLVFGVLSIAGLFLTDAAVHRINWAGPAAYSWIALFVVISVSAAAKLIAVSRITEAD